MLQTIKNAFSGAASNDDLSEAAIEKMERQIKPTRDELGQIDIRIAATEFQREAARHNGVTLQYETEALRAAELTSDLEKMNRTRGELAGRVGAAEAAITSARARLAEQKAIARLRSIPGLRRRFADEAATIEKLAIQLGRAMRAQSSLGKQLAEAIGTDEAKRILGPGALRASFIRLFRYWGFGEPDPEGGLHHFLWFEVAINGKLPPGTLVDHAEQILAEIAGFYATRQDAEAARRQVDPSGEHLHVIEDQTARVWTLRRGQLRGGFRPGDAGDARTEMDGARHED